MNITLYNAAQDNGGTVYPALAHYTDRHPTGGMTLRDHYAGLAIAGFSKGMVDYGWDDEVLDAHTAMASGRLDDSC